MHIVFIYTGILIGIFLEGEMIMISSVIAAHHGYLNLWLVIILGIAGTYCSDCFYFFLGRKKGKEWLNKHQKFKNKVAIIDKKLQKSPVIIYIGYRFLYGFRTIAPLVIGASKTKTNIFILFSAVSTLIWASVYCSIGYYLEK
jgi:membrane protein DedA with SNARE-associated domain